MIASRNEGDIDTRLGQTRTEVTAYAPCTEHSNSHRAPPLATAALNFLSDASQ